MSYWGTTKPTIKYGASYGTTWNLESDSVNCYYTPRWEKDRITQESDVNGHIEIFDKSDNADRGRMYLDIEFHDLTSSQVDKIRAMVQYGTFKVTLHSNSPNGWEEIFIVTGHVIFSSGENYPLKDTAFISLKSQDYVIIEDNVTT